MSSVARDLLDRDYSVSNIPINARANSNPTVLAASCARDRMGGVGVSERL